MRPIAAPKGSCRESNSCAVAFAESRLMDFSVATTWPMSANPLLTAKSIRPSTGSVIKINLRPALLAATAQRRPIAPAPIMVQVDPDRTPARRHAWTATDRGSSRAPSSNNTLAGNLNHELVGTLTQSRVSHTCDSTEPGDLEAMGQGLANV